MLEIPAHSDLFAEHFQGGPVCPGHHVVEADVPVNEVLEDRQKLRAAGRGSVINLYVGVPYCIKTEPSKCGYCLFPVEDFVGNDSLEDYFHNYLKKEAAMYKDALQGTTLGAVYFGGGTSNLYKPSMYPELMAMVRDLFPVIAPEVDLTLEGIPQLFTREKLSKIREAGMNRISIGVQQINEELNALSGRKQTTKHVVQTLEWAREFGLSCNVDLIFGWPQQTVSTMVKDLETIISWGVYDLTHYELNVGGPTDFALNHYFPWTKPGHGAGDRHSVWRCSVSGIYAQRHHAAGTARWSLHRQLLACHLNHRRSARLATASCCRHLCSPRDVRAIEGPACRWQRVKHVGPPSRAAQADHPRRPYRVTPCGARRRSRVRQQWLQVRHCCIVRGSSTSTLTCSVGCGVAVITHTPSGASNWCQVFCGTTAIMPALSDTDCRPSAVIRCSVVTPSTICTISSPCGCRSHALVPANLAEKIAPSR
jgi:hypothetical protein